MTTCTTCGAAGWGDTCARCGAPLGQPRPGGAHGFPTPHDLGDTGGTQAWDVDRGLADTQLAPAAPPPWPPAGPALPGDPYAGQAWSPAWPAQPPAPRARRVAPLIGAGAAVALLAVAGVALVPRLLPPGSAAAPAATAPVTLAPVTLAPARTAAPTLPTIEPAPAAPPAAAAPTPIAVTTTTTTTTRIVTAQAGAAGPDVLSGTWVVVLESLPKAEFTLAQARARAAALAASSGRTPKVLDSSATAPMRAGYWAVVDGPHASEGAAYATCAAYGRVRGGECYSRDLA